MGLLDGRYPTRRSRWTIPRGRSPPLLAPLLLVCVALPCGARAPSASADRGRHCGRRWLRHCGFTTDRAPCQPTRSRLCRRIPPRPVAAALGRWAGQARRGTPAAAGELAGLAIAGKTLRGSKRRGAADAQPLAAFSHRLGVVRGQTGGPDRTNASGVSDAFLRTLALAGRVVTADTLLTQREIARTIRDGGGDDRLVVQENQPTLHADIVAAFAPGADGTGLVGSAATVGQHGGRIAYRRLAATTALVGYSDWPGLQQALQIERRTIHKGTGRVLRAETAYAETAAVTSARPARGTPPRLLALWRGHWGIEI